MSCGGRKRLPVHHLSADYTFSGPFGITGLILSQFENRVPLKPVLWGIGGIAPLIFVSLTCFLLPENLQSELVLSSFAAGVVSCGGHKKVSPYIIIAQTIYFLVLSDHGLMSQFENRASLKSVPGGVCGVAPLRYCT